MRWTFTLSGLALLAGVSPAIDFEAPLYSGSPSGVTLTGQEGWYNPIKGSTDWNVYSYGDNAMGVVANPAGGGNQFAGGIAQPSPGFARAQRDFAWTLDQYVVRYDVNHRFLGKVAQNNLGSWSLQPSTTNIAGQDLHQWDIFYENWNLVLRLYDASGTYLQDHVPGPAWLDLQLNHWYRIEHTISFATNRWTETSITDLHNNIKNTATLNDLYMSGGATPTLPLPTASRFFAGGLQTTGNAFAVDNFAIVPETSTVLTIGVGLIVVLTRVRVSAFRARLKDQ